MLKIKLFPTQVSLTSVLVNDEKLVEKTSNRNVERKIFDQNFLSILSGKTLNFKSQNVSNIFWKNYNSLKSNFLESFLLVSTEK
jgi:hypothetical protein